MADATVIEPSSEDKNLEGRTFGLDLLQALEISQYRQMNLWKSLEKKALDLEIFGEKAWRFAPPPQ